MEAIPSKPSGATIFDLIDRVLDKGIVINADILVSVAGVELLGIRIRAAIASLQTAARYGLEFPSGTDLGALGWDRKQIEPPETCPECEKTVPRAELLDEGCPFCGWQSYRQKNKVAIPEPKKPRGRYR